MCNSFVASKSVISTFPLQALIELGIELGLGSYSFCKNDMSSTCFLVETQALDLILNEKPKILAKYMFLTRFCNLF